jgi:TolA-binding protein
MAQRKATSQSKTTGNGQDDAAQLQKQLDDARAEIEQLQQDLQKQRERADAAEQAAEVTPDEGIQFAENHIRFAVDLQRRHAGYVRAMAQGMGGVTDGKALEKIVREHYALYKPASGASMRHAEFRERRVAE